MITGFDFLTVGCFVCLVAAFFLLTERDSRTLTHLFLCGIAFAVANQLGNAGSTVLALILIIAGMRLCRIRGLRIWREASVGDRRSRRIFITD